MRELSYQAIDSYGNILNEIEEYENCLSLNSNVTEVKENNKKTFFGKVETKRDENKKAW